MERHIPSSKHTRQIAARAGLTPTAADEGTDAVVCQLCGRAFAAITASHLRMKHGARGVRPVRDYRRKFKLAAAACLRVRLLHRARRIRKVKREGRRWTRTRLRNAIRHLARSGCPPVYSRVPVGLYAAAQNHFGSWRAAVVAAGLPAGSHRSTERWTRDRIRDLIHARKRAGQSLAPSVVLREHHSLHRASTRHFGSWPSAVIAARIDPATYKGPRKWPPNRARAWVLDRMREGLSVTPKYVPRGLYARVRADTVGGWGAFVRSLGQRYDGVVRRSRMTEAEVVERIRQRAERGLAVTAFAVQRDEQRLERSARARFGSWAAAVRAAGLQPTPLRRTWTPDGVRAAVLARQLAGLPMDGRSVASDDERLHAAAIARFGTWRRAVGASRREGQRVADQGRPRPRGRLHPPARPRQA